MSQFDQDLCAVQEARVIAEKAKEAQEKLQTFTDRCLTEIIRRMISEIAIYNRELARFSAQETGYGCSGDKYQKNQFICETLSKRADQECFIGVLCENREEKTVDIGIPGGVIAAFLPAANPVSTLIYNVYLAIKSGNAVVFSPHPLARETTHKALDILIKKGILEGLPSGAISYVTYQSNSGLSELISHRAISRILITGSDSFVSAALKTGKPVIYGGSGNGPVFIERTADLEKAVTDIIRSKTFDYGTVSGAEQAVVAERCIAGRVKELFGRSGGYFMSPKEMEKLTHFLGWENSRCSRAAIGKPARVVAERAGFTVPEGTRLLIAELNYVTADSPFSKQNRFPVVSFLVENNWQSACETCIELLVGEAAGHTLVIHSRNEDVIREFALKKPVARMLVNTPSVFGSMGATTNLYPAMTFGSTLPGTGITTDNVSPANFTYVRKVGYGVRPF